MASFRYTFTSPIQPEDIDLGAIEGRHMGPCFSAYPWEHWLQKMEEAKEEDIHFSPTLNFEHMETRQKLLLSAVREGAGYLFYVFYQRPKRVKRLFGLYERQKDDYTTEVQGQTPEQALALVKAFAEGNSNYLETAIK